MKFFTTNETVGIIIILAAIALVSSYNFAISLRRSRDAQRKSDLGSISAALARFQNDFGVFPLASSDGKILACTRPEDKPFKDAKGNLVVNWLPCEWGKDAVRDVTDLSYPPYLNVLPADPQAGKGVSYVYFSDGSRFQIYTSLEGKDEDEYDPKIVKRNISCGARICNFGRASGKTPLDISIQEYENEIKQKN